ncbi:hypothetical protein FS749_013407 [Ceratobasidium sp. UAMH 11750]|nr:hypothetical protein FS749_013407 [Ceratobasidium sp. UAMH 11750]
MASDSTAPMTSNQPPRPNGATKRSRKRALSCSEISLGKDEEDTLGSQPQQHRRKLTQAVGPRFDETPRLIDPRWTDLPEKEAKHGRRPDQLARLLTRPCHPRGQELSSKNHHFRCIASSVCKWARAARHRQLNRIFTHAAHCQVLARWKPDLFASAERALASMAPGGFQPVAPDDAPSPNTTPQTASEASSTSLLPPNPLAQFDSTTHMSHFEQIDHAIVRLLCDSATPTRLVDYPAWTQLLHLVNPQLDYVSPSSSHVREKLIPAEAQRAVLHIRDFLRTQTNISLSFDGLSAGDHPVYTVHICTADRRTFLYYADVFYGSHNSDYIEDLLLKVVTELGAHRISSIVSDDTNVTKKARRLAVARHPSILNLADPVHKLNLCVQDICLDRLWAPVLIRLRKLLTHFKMSTQATAKLNTARKILGILRRLQSIGKTRFATLYYAALSVLENLPALYKIYKDGSIDTAANPLPKVVAEVLDETRVSAIKFKLQLTELVNILEPLARAISCLESTQSTISDVYFFWLAALAALNRHFSSTTSTLLTPEDISRLQAIIYYRFNEAINEAPTDSYITAFFLDPRYRTAAIYLDASNLQVPPPIVGFGSNENSLSRRKSNHSGSRLTRSLYSRVYQQLMWMLRDELAVGQKLPDHPLYQFDALRAKTELTAQLHQYHEGFSPFRRFSSDHESVQQYWTSHKSSHLTFILAYLAEKLFSVLPNSMCDERAGSRLSRLYSDLRTRLDANSMIEQIQFSQFMAMVDGSDLTIRRKKPLPHSRFCEIEQDTSLEYTDPKPVDDCPVALADEAGEEWLDGRVKGTLLGPAESPDFGNCASLGIALKAHCIDLNSPILINALSMTPADKLDMSPEGFQATEIVTDRTSITYKEVSEVSWDV